MAKFSTQIRRVAREFERKANATLLTASFWVAQDSQAALETSGEPSGEDGQVDEAAEALRASATLDMGFGPVPVDVLAQPGSYAGRAGHQITLQYSAPGAAAREFGTAEQPPQFYLRGAAQNWPDHVTKALKTVGLT